MEVVQGFSHLSVPLIHPVLTIGNFDGVHVGHQRMIRLAVEKARARHGQCVVITFSPHPQEVLRPDLPPPPRITTEEEKREIFASLGVDLLIEQPFTREFASTSAREFFETILCSRVQAEAIVIGYDFGFGKNREGSIQTLTQLANQKGMELTLVSAQVLNPRDSEVISSSKIRELLIQGKLEQANALLGREFSYRGKVVQGDGRGRKIGFPTANLRFVESAKLSLPYGVYVTRAIVDGKEYPSVTNIGRRPTFFSDFGDFPAWIECHLLDLDLDLYDRQLEVRFLARLREEKKFENIAALKVQISEDIAKAWQLFRSNR